MEIKEMTKNNILKVQDYNGDHVKFVITEDEFNGLTFTKQSEEGLFLNFKCQQNEMFNVKVFTGKEDEFPWVSFVRDDVGVLISNNKGMGWELDEDENLLNIDASNEILLDYLI